MDWPSKTRFQTGEGGICQYIHVRKLRSSRHDASTYLHGNSADHCQKHLPYYQIKAPKCGPRASRDGSTACISPLLKIIVVIVDPTPSTFYFTFLIGVNSKVEARKRKESPWLLAEITWKNPWKRGGCVLSCPVSGHSEDSPFFCWRL